MSRSKISSVAGLVAASFILAACSGGAAQNPDAGSEQGEDSLDEGQVPATGVEGGPDFDLSGTEIVVTTSPPGAINMGTFFAYKRLEEWGADVETVIVTTTSGVQTIMAGRADIASQGSDEVILGAAEGAEMVSVGAPSTAMDYVLVGDESVQSVADLEGKAVGMSGPSGFDTLLTRFSLEDAGLDDNAARFVQIGGSPDRASALLTGQVQAATVFLEDWEELKPQAEDLHLVQYMADIVPEFPATAYFADRSFWEENGDVALALACANLQANTFLNSSEDTYVDYVLQVVPGATEEAARAIYQSGQEVDMWPEAADDILSVDGMSGLIDAMVETEEISSAVDPASVVDVSYLQEAEEMGCGGS